jgi:hypothetical protein
VREERSRERWCGEKCVRSQVELAGVFRMLKFEQGQKQWFGEEDN